MWPSWATPTNYCVQGQGLARDILVFAAPGILFLMGSLMVAESPRWLFRRGRTAAARAALLRSRSDEQAVLELQEMEAVAAAEKAKHDGQGHRVKESLLHRKYVIPFVLACIILACNQTTGVNSIIGYNTNILLQGGLSDVQAHWGYLILTVVNFHCHHRRRHSGGSQRPEVSSRLGQRGDHCLVALRSE